MTDEQTLEALSNAAGEYANAMRAVDLNYLNAVRRIVNGAPVSTPEADNTRGQNKHCGKCGKPGHNARTCKKAKADQLIHEALTWKKKARA
jgi:hypothetical protein